APPDTAMAPPGGVGPPAGGAPACTVTGASAGDHINLGCDTSTLAKLDSSRHVPGAACAEVDRLWLVPVACRGGAVPDQECLAVEADLDSPHAGACFAGED